MNKRLVVTTLITMTTIGIGFGQVPKPKPAIRPGSDAERATWNSGWELLGITETDFRTLGFDTRSKEQSAQIFGYLMGNRPTFTCEKYYKDKEELKRVHVFVERDNSGSMDAQEFVGQLRSRLSAIHDVSLVYSDSEADITVGAIAFPSESEGGRRIGYTASIVILTPCTFKSPSGYDKGEVAVQRLANHKLFTGASEENVLSRVSSSIDVSDLDDIRKAHADSLKLLNP